MSIRCLTSLSAYFTFFLARISRITRIFACVVGHGSQDLRIGRVLKVFSCYFLLQETCENMGWSGICESVVISVGYVLLIDAGASVGVFVTKFGFRVDAFLAVLAGISLFLARISQITLFFLVCFVVGVPPW